MNMYIAITIFAAAFFLLGLVSGSCMEIIRMGKLDRKGGAEL